MIPKRRAAGTLLLLALVGSRSFAACTDDATPVDGVIDGGGEDAPSPLSARCPDELPKDGALCRVPEGTTCELGRCATRIVVCTQGRWRVGTNPAPTPPCPAAAPELGAACPPCWPAERTCRYGSVDCSQPDASANTAFASCPLGVWDVTISPCRDASADVSTDVQDDADAGAD